MTKRQQTFKDAVQQYGKKLFSFIRKRVKNDADAEDILQDVWYQLYSASESEPISRLSSWLFRVSTNKIIDRSRKEKMLLYDDFMEMNDDGDMYMNEAMFAEEIFAADDFEKQQLKEAFFTALNELPEKQRQVFEWNELDDMTLQQIADKTGENLKTIISRKRYAVGYLRKKMQEVI